MNIKERHDTNIPKIKVITVENKEGFYIFHTGFNRLLLASARFRKLDDAINLVNTSFNFSDWEYTDLIGLIDSDFFAQYKFLRETIIPTLKGCDLIY